MLGRKTIWTDEMIQFINDNWETMTNPQLAEALGLTLTVTRNQLRKMGLKRMELEYWTEEQIEYLKANYKTKGDVELAEEFTKRWKKNKGWTKKHIEKKRRYLKLKRTENEKATIFKRNKEHGRFRVNHWKRWYGRETKLGTVKIWNIDNSQVPVIKVGSSSKISGGYQKLSHYNWEIVNGSIPKGCMIVHKDKDTTNCNIENLECITKAENAKRNCGSNPLTDKYIAAILTRGNKKLRKEIIKQPEIIELKRQSLLLNRSIENGLNKKAG